MRGIVWTAPAVLVGAILPLGLMTARGVASLVAMLAALLAIFVPAVWHRNVRVVPLAAIGGYFFGVFCFRPAVLLIDPHRSRVLTAGRGRLEEQVTGALWIAVLALAVVIATYAFLTLLPPRPCRPLPISRRRAHRPLSLPPAALVLTVVVSSVSLALLVEAAGGFTAAIGRSRVVRAELQGSLFLLSGIWFGNVVGLASLLTYLQQGRRRDGLTAVFLLAIGIVASAVIGSRGSAVPPLVAAGVLILRVRWVPDGGALSVRQASAAGILLVAGLGGLAMYGALRNASLPAASSVPLSEWAGGVLADVRVADVADQFDEFDYLVWVRENRRHLPSGANLGVRLLGVPEYALPSALVADRPVPYDFDVRRVAVGGIVETGLPASLVGESWLISGIPGVVIAHALLGWAAWFLADRLARFRSPASLMLTSIVLGHLYLVLSRPLLVSISRLLIYGSFIVIVYLIANFHRHLLPGATRSHGSELPSAPTGQA